MDILDSIAQEIFSFKAYPNNQELEFVSAALIEKYPCLKDPGSGTGYYSWTMSIKYKVGNYHQKLRSAGCTEVTVNQKKSEQGLQMFKESKEMRGKLPPRQPSRADRLFLTEGKRSTTGRNEEETFQHGIC